MKFLFLPVSFLLASMSLAQSPDDSVLNRWKRDVDSIKKSLSGTIDHTKPSVVLVSESQAVTKRDTSTWNGRWQMHVDKESNKIIQKMLLKGVEKASYKVLVAFSINEDGSLKDLKVSSTPNDAFVVQLCREMALSAPKRKPVYKNGKYVRAHISQPVEIKIDVAGH